MMPVSNNKNIKLKEEDNSALRNAGLKITLPRLKILKLLSEPKFQHVTAEDLYKKLIDMQEEIGLATVYRVLNQFDDAGIVTRHNFEGGKAVFELATQEHHDHLVCLDCGEVFEFQDEIINNRQKIIAKEHGIKLAYHSLYLYGHCSVESCKKHAEINNKSSQKRQEPL